MKKPIIALIALLVLAAASFIAFFIVKNNEDEKAADAAAKAADYVLFDFDPESIDLITFDCPDGVYQAELDENDEWQLKDSDEFIMSHLYAQTVCNYVSSLTADKDYGEADGNKKELYGLNDPVSITFSNASEEYTVHVGDLDPTSSYYYVMTDSKSKIYAIPASTGSALRTTRIMMKNTFLSPYTDSEIASVELFKDGEEVYNLTYNENDSIWNLGGNYSNFEVDQTVITTIISYITRAEAQEFFEENFTDYAKYGFDDPHAKVVITGKDGKSYSLLFSRYGTNTKTYTHVLFEDFGQAAIFYTGDVDFIDYEPYDFLVKTICNVSIHDIIGIDYVSGDIDTKFDVKIAENKIDMNGENISSLSGDVSIDFTTFYNSIIYREFTKLDFDITPDTNKLFSSVTFHMADGSDKVLEIYEYNDEECTVFIDGEYTGAIVKRSDFTGKNSVEYYYNELIDTIYDAQ